MWALFDILRYSISSVIWGILIAIGCMALFVFLIKGWYKDATFSPLSYVVGALLFILLSFQCIMIVGSLKIIEMSDEYEQQISAIVESAYSSSEIVSMSQASDIIERIIDEFPILQYYVEGGKFSGFEARELPQAITQELSSFMRWYIFRRILWCLGFVVLGAIYVIKSMSKNNTRHRPQRIQNGRSRISRRPRR